ncbi:hypothetical protein L204_104293 [Cryptococcus depauperatus]|nr:hypothetical protein L204_04880 [Cryptococcus depauperatus CBS 7855]
MPLLSSYGSQTPNSQLPYPSRPSSINDRSDRCITPVSSYLGEESDSDISKQTFKCDNDDESVAGNTPLLGRRIDWSSEVRIINRLPGEFAIYPSFWAANGGDPSRRKSSSKLENGDVHSEATQNARPSTPRSIKDLGQVPRPPVEESKATVPGLYYPSNGDDTASLAEARTNYSSFWKANGGDPSCPNPSKELEISCVNNRVPQTVRSPNMSIKSIQPSIIIFDGPPPISSENLPATNIEYSLPSPIRQPENTSRWALGSSVSRRFSEYCSNVPRNFETTCRSTYGKGKSRLREYFRKLSKRPKGPFGGTRLQISKPIPLASDNTCKFDDSINPEMSKLPVSAPIAVSSIADSQNSRQRVFHIPQQSPLEALENKSMELISEEATHEKDSTSNGDNGLEETKVPEGGSVADYGTRFMGKESSVDNSEFAKLAQTAQRYLNQCEMDESTAA